MRDIIVQLGGGLSFTKTEFTPHSGASIDEPYDDNHLPGLNPLLKYLRLNYRKLDDDSVINNTYNVNNKYNSRIQNDETLFNINDTKTFTSNNISKIYNIYDNITNFNTKHTHFKQFHHNLTQESQFVKQIINNKIIKNTFSEDITNINAFHNKNVYQNIKKYEQLYKQADFHNCITQNHKTISYMYNVNDTMFNVSNNVSKYTSNFLNFNDT